MGINLQEAMIGTHSGGRINPARDGVRARTRNILRRYGFPVGVGVVVGVGVGVGIGVGMGMKHNSYNQSSTPFPTIEIPAYNQSSTSLPTIEIPISSNVSFIEKHTSSNTANNIQSDDDDDDYIINKIK